MKTKAIIRKYIKSQFGWSDEIDHIAAIEFAFAPRTQEWTEIHHVVVTHEYSTETRFEVIRVTVTGPREGDQAVTYAERVFMS